MSNTDPTKKLLIFTVKLSVSLLLQLPQQTVSWRNIITFRYSQIVLQTKFSRCTYHVYTRHYKKGCIKFKTHYLIQIYRMTLSCVLILVLMCYCTSGIRAMSIQNESDHAQLDELRQTVADLSTKIEVLNETKRKGKIDLILIDVPRYYCRRGVVATLAW